VGDNSAGVDRPSLRRLSTSRGDRPDQVGNGRQLGCRRDEACGGGFDKEKGKIWAIEKIGNGTVLTSAI